MPNGSAYEVKFFFQFAHDGLLWSFSLLNRAACEAQQVWCTNVSTTSNHQKFLILDNDSDRTVPRLSTRQFMLGLTQEAAF